MVYSVRIERVCQASTKDSNEVGTRRLGLLTVGLLLSQM
uniref:Uncharacterized protein n=1 Tax=Anguilla anguilla TaxID=7936 RepID=A0A0E9WB99_ANGAN